MCAMAAFARDLLEADCTAIVILFPDRLFGGQWKVWPRHENTKGRRVEWLIFNKLCQLTPARKKFSQVLFWKNVALHLAWQGHSKTGSAVVPKTNSCKQFRMHSLQLPLSTVAIWMSNSEYPMDLLWFRLWMKQLKFNKCTHNKEELIVTRNTTFSTRLIQSDLREIQDVYNKNHETWWFGSYCLFCPTSSMPQFHPLSQLIFKLLPMLLTQFLIDSLKITLLWKVSPGSDTNKSQHVNQTLCSNDLSLLHTSCCTWLNLIIWPWPLCWYLQITCLRQGNDMPI